MGEAQGDQVLERELPAPDGFDAVVFAVPHSQYAELDLLGMARSGEARSIVDASRVLDVETNCDDLAGRG